MPTMHCMAMTLRFNTHTPSPRTLSFALARLRDGCFIGCAAIGLAVSLNLGTCEPEKRPPVFAGRAMPHAGSNLSTLAPIMQTGPRKGEGDGVPRQGLRCAKPKVLRMVLKMPASAKPDAFAV